MKQQEWAHEQEVCVDEVLYQTAADNSVLDMSSKRQEVMEQCPLQRAEGSKSSYRPLDPKAKSSYGQFDPEAESSNSSNTLPNLYLVPNSSICNTTRVYIRQCLESPSGEFYRCTIILGYF